MTSKLEQLKQYTTVVADTGDVRHTSLEEIEREATR